MHWADKMCLTPSRVSTGFVTANLLSILGAQKNWKIFVDHKVSITWMYKVILESTWIWRFSLKEKLEALMIVVFLASWVLIIIHAASRSTNLLFDYFHLTTMWNANILASFFINDLHLESEIEFSWLMFSFKS